MSGRRWPKLVVVISSILIGASAFVALKGNGGARRDVVPRTAAQQLELALAQSIDSIAAQRAAAVRLLGWFEERESVSSASAMEDLRRLRFSERLTFADHAEQALRARGAARHDWQELMRLRTAAAGTHDEVEHAHRELRLRLDRDLPPGVWYYLNDMDAGPHTVDFRGALRDLDAAGFESALRAVLRTLDVQLDELAAIRAETAALERALPTEPDDAARRASGTQR